MCIGVLQNARTNDSVNRRDVFVSFVEIKDRNIDIKTLMVMYYLHTMYHT